MSSNSSLNAVFEPRTDAGTGLSLLTAIVAPNAPSEAVPDPGSASGTPPNSHLRKRKAPPEPTQPDLLSLRRKDVHNRLANLVKTIDAATQPPPTLVASIPRLLSSQLKSRAADIWYNVVGVSSSSAPAHFDIEQISKEDIVYQDSKAFHLFKRPVGCEYLRCIPCVRNGDWHAWVNRASGLTKALRTHMVKYHAEEYTAKCKLEGVDPTALDLDDDLDAPQPLFTRDGLVERLVRWIAIDDQSLNSIERPEFRELLLYCGQGILRNVDIPHRDKIAFEAHAFYLREKATIILAMQESQGQISLTSDLWSDEMLRSFMAVTAHYINSAGELTEHLVAFCKIDGQHTGANVGQVLFNVLDDTGIIDKLGLITLDNASNNDTLMVELSEILKKRGLSFDPEENRVRCFPHVMNLAVQAFLRRLPEAGQRHRAVLAELKITPTPEQSSYLDTLEEDPIGSCRSAVVACRASGTRRDGLRQTIVEGNISGRFKTADGEVFTVPELELIRDCPTRWASTGEMVDRYIELYLPITDFSLRNHGAGIPALSHRQYEVLQDVSTILTVATRAQQLLSAERTPTLALALPVYETVLDLWKDCREIFPEQSFAIDAAIMKIDDYVFKSRKSSIHALAMFVNPSLKFEWIDKHWRASDALKAREVVKQRLLHYAQERYDLLFNSQANTRTAASRAAQAQSHGYRALLSLENTLRRADRTVAPTLGLPNSPLASSSSSPVPTRLQPVSIASSQLDSNSSAPHFSAAQLAIQHLAAVESEIVNYVAMAPLPAEKMGSVNIVARWKELRHLFPLIHKLAMDVLPVQASSVSSERVFSSSKMTCTRERGRMSVGMVEALQVLKHSLKRRRVVGTSSTRSLDFMSKVDTPGDDVIE